MPHTRKARLPIASGVPIDAVQAWLGHASLATTATYLHTAQSQTARQALDGWATAMRPVTSINAPVSDNTANVTLHEDGPNVPSA